MLCSPLSQHHSDPFRPVVYLNLQRIARICHDPLQQSHDPQSRSIQDNFGRQTFAIAIIHHVEGPEAPSELRFQVVVPGLRDHGLAADILNGASGFDGLQNGDNLLFG